MTNKMQWLAMALAAAGATACDSTTGTSGTDSGGITAEQFPAKFATALCTSMQNCASTYFSFASVDNCVAMMLGPKSDFELNTMVADVKAGKIKYDSAQAGKCVAAAAAGNCDFLQTPKAPPACVAVFTGTLAANAACTGNDACSTRFCDKAGATAGSGCGKCAALKKAGDTCADSQGCEGLLLCVAGKCGTAGSLKAGDLCNQSVDCAPELYCAGGDAANPGVHKCQPRVASGKPCEVGDACLAGLACVSDQKTKTSTCLPLGKENDACTPGEHATCVSPLACAFVGDMGKPETLKTLCLPLAKLGGACQSAMQCGVLDATCKDGKCALLPKKGEACVPVQPGDNKPFSAPCTVGMVCDPTKKLCVDPPAGGQPCIQDQCAPDTDCHHDGTDQVGKCVARPGNGQDCPADGSPCAKGLDCMQGKCMAPMCM